MNMIMTNHQVAPQSWFGEDGVLCMRDLLNYIFDESHCAMIDCVLSVRARAPDLKYIFLQASKTGNVLLVNYMLRKRIFAQLPSSITSSMMGSAFESAVIGDQMEVVDALLAAGADTDVSPSSAALQIAVVYDNLSMVERLLRANADVNAPLLYMGFFPNMTKSTKLGGRDLNAIQLAAGFGSLDIVEMLLLAGADVNAPAAEDNGLTALQAAALHGHLNVVRRLLSSHADVNAAPAKNSGYTLMQAAEKSESFDVIEVLLKPLGVLQVYVESAQGFTSSYPRIVISGIEMARTKTAQKGSRLFRDVSLHVPLCHATREICIEVVDQNNRRKYYCQLSHSTVVSDLVAETDGILMMRQPLRRTYYGNHKDSKLSCVISFYPCLTPQGVSKQPTDNETVQSNPDVQTPWDLTRLDFKDDPSNSLDELIKCETGFIMFKFLDWKAPPGTSSVQIQVLLHDLLFPSYSYTVAQIKNSQLKRVGHCFIHDLSHSKITFRLMKGGGQFDDTGRVYASRTQNILDLLKHCLVCVHTPL